MSLSASVKGQNMPETEAEPMVTIKFAVPSKLLDDALALAENEGWKPAEFHRKLWDAGLKVGLEQSNKLLINRRLRSRPAIDELTALLKAVLESHQPIDPDLKAKVEAAVKSHES